MNYSLLNEEKSEIYQFLTTPIKCEKLQFVIELKHKKSWLNLELDEYTFELDSTYHQANGPAGYVGQPLLFNSGKGEIFTTTHNGTCQPIGFLQRNLMRNQFIATQYNSNHNLVIQVEQKLFEPVPRIFHVQSKTAKNQSYNYMESVMPIWDIKQCIYVLDLQKRTSIQSHHHVQLDQVENNQSKTRTRIFQLLEMENNKFVADVHSGLTPLEGFQLALAILTS